MTFLLLYRLVIKTVSPILLLFQPIDSLLVVVLYKDLHELLESIPSNNDAPKNK